MFFLNGCSTYQVINYDEFVFSEGNITYSMTIDGTLGGEAKPDMAYPYFLIMSVEAPVVAGVTSFEVVDVKLSPVGGEQIDVILGKVGTQELSNTSKYFPDKKPVMAGTLSSRAMSKTEFSLVNYQVSGLIRLYSESAKTKEFSFTAKLELREKVIRRISFLEKIMSV